MNKILFLLAIFTLPTFAGHEAGGGGAIVCPAGDDGHAASIQTLDLYEAKEVYGLEVDYGPKHLKAMERVQYVLNRFSKSDPGRAARYLRDAENFMKTGLFKSGVNLGPVNLKVTKKGGPSAVISFVQRLRRFTKNLNIFANLGINMFSNIARI